ncbi:hypothetical protein AYK26_07255 [Euryarchaeota archaeon SM23-78]|nr:MAG: hypothetical protein AYK26_07255 [Euryarchaeota archaeon SM23-78]
MIQKSITKPKNFVYLIIIILITIYVYGQNDPGHDTLYIEEQGDSELNGSLNITKTTFLRGKSLIQSYLDLYANGTLPTPTYGQIAGLVDSLYIDSPGNIYLNAIGGGGGAMIYLGTTGDTVSLNVTGNVTITGALNVLSSIATVNGKDICLADGTNCLGGNNTGNVSSVSAAPGTPLTASPTTGNVVINISIPTCSGTDKLTYNGTHFECATDQDAGGGGNISGDGAADRIAFFTGGSTISYSDNLKWDSSANKLGIGTTSTTAKITIDNVGNNSTFGYSAIYIPDAGEGLYFDYDGGIAYRGTGQYWSHRFTATDFMEPDGEILGIYKEEASEGDTLVYPDANQEVIAIFRNDGTVGIGDKTPDAVLDVQSNSTSTQLMLSYDDNNHGNFSVTSDGNLTIKATNHVIIDLS